MQSMRHVNHLAERTEQNGGGWGTRTPKPEGAGFQDRCVTNYANPPQGSLGEIVPYGVTRSRIEPALFFPRLQILGKVLHKESVENLHGEVEREQDIDAPLLPAVEK